MKLLDFIPYLVDPDKLAAYYRQIGIGEHSVCPLIYLRDALSESADIAVFELEETSDDILFTKNGVDYISLLAVDQAIELIRDEFSPKLNAVSHRDIASRIIEYATYDA